ncbi:Prohibitin-4, mitochondrial, partial [Cucurbita argyrosperma subsp. sororia]
MISRLFWLKRAVTTVGVGLVSVLSASVYTVREGERAVIFDRFQGRINEKTVGEGKHFLLPWVQQAFIVDITTQPQKLTFQCRTKHLEFSREFSDSVELNQVAFQDYETAKIWTLIAEQQVKIGLIWADAEAKRSNHQNGWLGTILDRKISLFSHMDNSR